MSDIIENAKIIKMEGFLVTMDIQKAFDSLDHMFLISDFIKSGIMCSYCHNVFSARKTCPSRQSNFILFIYFSLGDLISTRKIKI